jgi:hypothetical protein
LAFGPADAATLRVPEDQPTLKAAVAAAASGDVILFAPGTYAGGVIVENKSLFLASRFRDTGDTSYVSRTIISGITSYCSGVSNCRGDAVLEFGSNAHGSAVIGLTIRDGSNKGIRSGSIVDIDHCHVVQTSDGTNYTSGSGGTFSNNLFANNSDDGIDLNYNVKVRVIDNIIRNNGDDGIEFRLYPYSGPEITTEFVGNRITGNVQDGIQFIDYSDSSHRVLRVDRNYFGGNRRAAVGFLADGNTVQDFSGPPVPERLHLTNNTFVANNYALVGGANVAAVNNLFIGCTNAAVRRVRVHSIAAYNLFWSNLRDYEESNVDLAHTLRADPLLQPDTTLGPGSPAIDAGIASFVWGGRQVLDLVPPAFAGAAPDLGMFESGVVASGPTIRIDDASVLERHTGSVTLGFPVRLSAPADQDVTVDFVTTDATATAADHDYAPTAGTLTIPASATTASIAVTVYGDARPEADEGFDVVLSRAANAALARARARGTIVNDDGTPATIDVRVAAGADDAEESSSGSVSTSSSDLDLLLDGSTAQRAAGVRFAAVTIPPGATVTAAWIQFKAKEAQSEATSLVVRAQTIDTAPAFVATSGNVTSRALTSARASWTPIPSWSVGQADAAQRTPDLALVLQEIVDRSGWRAGNAIALVITGTGRRVAYSFESGATNAAVLHVEYFTGPVANRAPRVDAGPDTTMAFPNAAMLRGTATDDGLPAPSSMTTRWTLVGGAGTVTFDDARAPATRAAFGVPGDYRLELAASDGELEARDSVTVHVLDPSRVPTIVESRVAAGADDAEEASGGAVSLSSSDLEMMLDGTIVQSTVGVRFAALAIPTGATVTSAWIQFKSKEARADATTLAIRAQAIDQAPPFTTASRNVSTRAPTSAQIAWPSIAAWAVGQASAAQRTPDLAGVVQEVVSRAGWRSGNAIAFVVTGTGRRVAYAFESGAANVAVLHVEYVVPPPNLAPRVDAGPDTAVFVTGAAFLRGSASDDGRPSPGTLVTRWSRVGDAGVVTLDDPASTVTRATFDAPGDYRLELSASDGAIVTRDTVAITVMANRPPLADVTVDVSEGFAPLAIVADASASQDPDGDGLSYLFDFGDGSLVGPQSQATAPHTYDGGDWTLKVIVADGKGGLDTASVGIAVQSNLVTNPSFETSLAGWNANGTGAVVARVEGGYESRFAIEAKGGTSLATFGVNDSPNWVSTVAGAGERYRFSAWVRSVGHSGKAQLKVREYLNGVLQGTPLYSTAVDLEPEWQEIVLEVTATVEASTFDFQVVDKPRVPGEAFQVDEIEACWVSPDDSSWAGPGLEAAASVAIGTPLVFGARVYPNPPTTGATLDFVTTRSGFARVRIHDAQGRLIRTLLDTAALPAGRHSLLIETRGPRGRLGAGMYFYSVQAAEGRLMGKIVILE